MKLESPSFKHEGEIPPKHTCDGQNTNPPLKITEAPKEAKTLVLLMEDPDVPKTLRKDGMWDHWIVFNIPPETTDIPEGMEPLGTHGRGTANNFNYHGPCPPDKRHRYYFKLYALDCYLDLPEGCSKKKVLESMQGSILAEATLMGTYERRK